MIKDNQPEFNGIYKLSRISVTKGFVLTKKIALDKLPSATIYVLGGVVNKGSLWALVRRTRKANMLDFELIQSNNYPLRNIINEDDKTELELSNETKTFNISDFGFFAHSIFSLSQNLLGFFDRFGFLRFGCYRRFILCQDRSANTEKENQNF